MGFDFDYYYPPYGFCQFDDDFKAFKALSVSRHALRPVCGFYCFIGRQMIYKECSNIVDLIRERDLLEFDALLDSKTFEIAFYMIKSPFCRALFAETHINKAGFLEV